MKKILLYAFLLFLAALEISPLLFLAAGAFMDPGEIMDRLGAVLSGEKAYVSWHLIPRYPSLRNLVELLFDSPEFFQMFWNSVKISTGILAGQLLIATPAAWGLARYSFRGKKGILLLYIIMMMMPFQVTMLSEYLVLDRLHLMNSHAAVILPGIFSTFSVFIMYRFFGSIPDSILEAARIDGAGEVRIFLQMGIPLGSSGILSAMVLSFLECWNMIEQPMTFLTGKNLWPLSLFLPQITDSNAGLSLCVSFAALIPAVLVFLAGQDYLEQGIAESGGSYENK